MRTIFIVLVSIYLFSSYAFAENCDVIGRRSPTIKNFVDYFEKQVPAYSVTKKMNTLDLLKNYLVLTRKPIEALDLLLTCVSSHSIAENSDCYSALEYISFEIFIMNRHLRDAQACDFHQVLSSYKADIESMITLSEGFNRQLIEAFHRLEWAQGMQKSLRETLREIQN